MLNMDHYVNNSYDAESAVDSYNTYIVADLDFRDANGNTVHRRVKKCVRNNYGQALGVVNWNPWLDTIKYKVAYIAGYI